MIEIIQRAEASVLHIRSFASGETAERVRGWQAGTFGQQPSAWKFIVVQSEEQRRAVMEASHKHTG
jgi:hypothetical protein